MLCPRCATLCHAVPCCATLCRRCTSPKASQAFYAAVGSSDKTMKLVPGGYHEVLFSPGVSEGLVAGMTEWIKQHLGGGGGAAKM